MPPPATKPPAAKAPGAASLRRARDRVRWLRVAVAVLGCAVVARWAHSGPNDHNPPPQQGAVVHAATTALAARHTRPRAGRGGVGRREIAAARAKEDVAFECSPDTLFEMHYPLVCFAGEPLAFAFLGGDSVAGSSFWSSLPNTAAMVIMNHAPHMTIRTEIGLMTSLVWLTFINSVAGTVPSEVGLLTRLTYLYTLRNSMTGTLPSEIALLPLTVFAMSRELGLGGAVPTEIALVSTLTMLDLFGVPVGGRVMSELAQLPSLRFIDYGVSNAYGQIPSQWGLAPALQDIDVGGNPNITGGIPTELGNVGTLTALGVGFSGVAGTIPSELGRLSRLAILDVRRAFVHGTIPTQLGLLSVSSLLLNNNFLSGTLPPQILSIPNLQVLNISLNALTGTLPAVPEGVTVYCDHSGLDDPLCPLPPGDFVDEAVVWVVFGLAGFVLAAIVVAAAFIVAFRREPVIRATNPLFSVLTLLSLGLVTSALFPYGLTVAEFSDGVRSRSCEAMVHLGAHGMTMLLCCITVRNYPIWKIFVNNKRMLPVRLKRSQLLAPVCANVAVTAVVVWAVTGGIEPKHGAGCRQDGSSTTAALALLVYVLVLSILATVISFQIRNTPSEYNDTQNIGKAMYLVMTFGTALVVVSYMAEAEETRFLSISLCFVLCVLTFVLTVHATKVAKLGSFSSVSDCNDRISS